MAKGEITVLVMVVDTGKAKYLRNVLQDWSYSEKEEPKIHRKYRRDLWLSLDNYLNLIEDVK